MSRKVTGIRVFGNPLVSNEVISSVLNSPEFQRKAHAAFESMKVGERYIDPQFPFVSVEPMFKGVKYGIPKEAQS